jgi:hypothetical protein
LAHPRVIAQRQAIAVERLMASAHKLAKQHGLKDSTTALTNAVARDPAEAQMLQTEALADLLEGIEGGQTAKPKADDLAQVEQQLEAETGSDVVKTGDDPPTFVETDKPVKPSSKGKAT